MKNTELKEIVTIDGKELEHFITTSETNPDSFKEIIAGIEKAIGLHIAWARMEGYRDLENGLSWSDFDFRFVGFDRIYSFNVTTDMESKRAVFKDNNGTQRKEFAIEFEKEK